MDTASQVLLVDAEDRPLGLADKLEAHRRGQLHRAFSVFVFDAAGRTLLQRRAAHKYHSGGLWSNACCSHPLAAADLPGQARARLRQEMGLDCALTVVDQLVYRAPVGADLCEHEWDHVLCGRADARPEPDPAEVMDWRWAEWAALEADLAARPEHYSAWLGLIVTRCGAALARFRAGARGVTPPP